MGRSWNAYYVPMVSLKFWNNLPTDLQKIIEEIWDELLPKQKMIAGEEQEKTQKVLQSKGMNIYELSK